MFYTHAPLFISPRLRLSEDVTPHRRQISHSEGPKLWISINAEQKSVLIQRQKKKKKKKTFISRPKLILDINSCVHSWSVARDLSLPSFVCPT